MVRFSHIADCHIGSWRDSRMTELNFLSFVRAIDISVEKNVDFILISGDLFNTSMPSIDYINSVVKEFVKLKERNIPVYIIAGSHDFSPSGKTILKILESAELVKNVLKADVVDGILKLNVINIPEFKIQLSGMLGKKGTLEKHYYEALDYDFINSQLKEDWLKIFLFHSAISEFKPEDLKDMPSQPMSVLPKNFDYYAGGHVHYRFIKKLDDAFLVFPGPTFPNNFKELEDLLYGSFVLVDYNSDNSNNSEKFNIEVIELKLKEVLKVKLNLSLKTPFEAKQFLIDYFDSLKDSIKDKIVLLRLFGKLDGSVMDINFSEIFNYINGFEPFILLRNTLKLDSIKDDVQKINFTDLENIESKFISENGEDPNFVSSLINILSSEKREGETNSVYEERVINDAILKLNEKFKE